MRQPGWERNSEESGYMYCWVSLLSTWNHHNIGNQLYSNTKYKGFFKKILILERYFQGIMPNSYCCLVPKSCPTLLWPPWTVAHQAPLSMGFSRQECWSGLPFPSPGDLPNTGIKPASPAVGGRGEWGWRCVLYLCTTREALPLLFNWWDDYIPTHAVRHWL